MLALLGLFSIFAKKKQDNALLTFLEIADDAYMKSYVNKDVRYIIQYADESVCQQVQNDIRGDIQILFGTRKSRIRKWTVGTCADDIYTIKKSITHKDIQVTKGLKIAMGDAFDEV